MNALILGAPSESDPSLENWPEELVRILEGPIIIYSSPLAPEIPIPDWLRQQIRVERLFRLHQKLRGEDPEPGRALDSEAYVYLIGATEERPWWPDEWHRLYFWLAKKTHLAAQRELPAPLLEMEIPEELEPPDQDTLDIFKSWLYKRYEPSLELGADPPRRPEEEKFVREIAHALGGRIIVFGHFPDPKDVPDWLRHKIHMDRMIRLMKIRGGTEEPDMALDSEALAYLMPATLQYPFDRTWSEIYLWLSGKVLREAGQEPPPDVPIPEKLDRDVQRELDQLKRWLYARYQKLR